MRILVTGATGNVGGELLDQLLEDGHDVTAGTRDGRAPRPGVAAALVDFERGTAPPDRFDALFLMRPPHLTDATLFEAFLDGFARETRVVFLSVRGADRKSYLPHAKIEAKIAAMGFDHVFVRPSYFMENLLTTLWPDLERGRRIILPAGSLELDWVLTRDVASVAKAALTGRVAGEAVAACTGRRAGFAEVCATINRIAGTQVEYRAVGLLAFLSHSRRLGRSWPFIGVMLLLHFLPRFVTAEQEDCGAMRGLLRREPDSLADFVTRNLDRFERLK
jgi:uncharacterized protein YbjT (DUF2867 family)